MRIAREAWRKDRWTGRPRKSRLRLSVLDDDDLRSDA